MKQVKYKKARLKCEHCGYEWQTKSKMKKPTCPSCHLNTKRIELE